MISILAKNTLYITHIICTETILDRQEQPRTIFYLILNKVRKDTISTKNDSVIDLKF